MKNIRQKIKTSYSISENNFKKLQNAAEICNITPQKLIRIVMARYIRNSHRKLISEDNVMSYNSYGQKNFKRIYIRWNAAEYSIIQQFKFNTRHSTSFTLEKAINKCLERIVMAILKKNTGKRDLTNKFFQKIMMKLDRYFIFWPNINLDPKTLPFFQMHLDYLLY